MADDSFVQFLRRKSGRGFPQGYAQDSAVEAIATYGLALKDLETMCADPTSDSQALVKDGDRSFSLGDVRHKARSLSESLALLMGETPLTDEQATEIISPLIHSSHDLIDAARQYPHLAGASGIVRESENLISLVTGLEGLRDAHFAGIEEGLKRSRVSRTEPRGSGAKPPCSHSGRSGGR